MIVRLAVCVLPFALGTPAQQSIRGFPTAAAIEQRAWETKAQALPDAMRIRSYMQRMSARPHHAGSAGSREVAEYAAGLLKEWGLDAKIEPFEALLPYPTTRIVEMIEPVRFQTRLREETGDATQLATFNAYSAAGDVTAPLVYVNYGIPDDYEYLKRHGIDVKGKIVIARYGKSWRGTKPKVAAENGAVACIIYSDPRDDGYFQGDVYPKGPFRPPSGVQRGSVMDMPLYVGDPLSPGWASETGSRRLKIEEAQTLMRIPVLPMSYEDAAELLRHVGGPVAPEQWCGALGFTYHIGPGPAKVRIKLDFDMSTRPVLNVLANIPGSEFPDQWILYGNHHDAWVNGANDPLSGASALLESARTLAELRKAGWKPKRGIKFALWDAEEYGLIGSTEWVEKHKDELVRKMAVYLNSDTTGKGTVSASGSPSLQVFVAEALRDLKDPVSKKPLLEARREQPRRDGSKPEAFSLGPLGAGSDYVAFFHHAGISSLNLGFGGEGGGVYHSIHDTFDWYTRFSDGDFQYGKTFSAMMTTLLMRLADAPLLPFEFPTLARALEKYESEVAKLANRQAKFDTKELRAEITQLTAAAKSLESVYSNALHSWKQPSRSKLAQVNEMLYRAERQLAPEPGLPGRNWYKHQLSSPGLYTGYGAKTLPGIREAAEAGRWEEANQQVKEASKAVRALKAELVRITASLQF
ncbi:MAG: M28 family peptidase [Candidatus Solibacter usitatus]|nr:M28 family peptidase [Candidatus Solibacter usitatus]